MNTITARQLREILFYLKDQDMTVQELRDALFQVEDQDQEFPVDYALPGKLNLLQSKCCPGCGIEEGEGINPDCDDPNGCGYWKAMS